MIPKTNLRQRAISDFNFTKKKSQQTVILLQQGRLFINVARLGQMYAYARLRFGKQEATSEPSETGGLNPKWNQFFSFNLGSERSVKLTILDKSVIFGETEIGSTLIDFAEVIQGKQNFWWKIFTLAGQVAGEVLLQFELTKESPIHTPNSSWDLKIGQSPLSAGKGHFKHLTLTSSRTPEMKMTHCSTEPDELGELETLRVDLIKESERIKNQEKSFRIIFEKHREEMEVLRKEKIEIEMQKECLQKKEECILNRKREIEVDRGSLGKEWEEIERVKQHLNTEFLKLKEMKLRVKVEKLLQQKLKIQINKNASRNCRQFESLRKLDESN